MKEDQNIAISVAFITYNHVDYVKQALDSVLNQKLNCKYEIVIGDDCSTDGTLEIIEQYKTRYPEIIRIIERKRNVGPTRNVFDVFSNCKGKYLILLEGDDYYTDQQKLQKQYDFLETHSEFQACAHRLEIVDKQGEHILFTLADLKLDNAMNEKHFELYNTDMLHLNTVMFRNYFLENPNKYDILYKSNNWSVHSLLLLIILNVTDIYVFSDAMTVWRSVNEAGASNYTSQASSKALEIYEEKLKLYKHERVYFKNSNLKINFKKMLLLCYWDGIKRIKSSKPTNKAEWRKRYASYIKKSERVQAVIYGIAADGANALKKLAHSMYRKIKCK